MSTELIDAEKDYGFTLTRFAGPKGRGRMYQITGGDRPPCSDTFEPAFVLLDHFQMVQLVSAFVMDHNKEATRTFF